MKTKMKIWAIGMMAVMVTMMTVGCNKSNTAYSNQRAREKKLISTFMSTHGYRIVKTMPTDAEFAADPNLFYEFSEYDNLYYHLDKRGDSLLVIGDDTLRIDPIVAGEKVAMRYKQFTLTTPSDTMDYWTTLNAAYPTEFAFGTDYKNGCTGWHMAVREMKYTDSECTLIVPSTVGTQAANDAVIPYGYKLRMKINR